MEALFSLGSSLFTVTSLILVLGGCVVGIMGVVFGGGLFFAAPLMQWLFPAASFGTIIGNAKVGGLARSISSTIATWNEIKFKECLEVGVPAIMGTMLGALFVSHLSQSWLLPATILAVAVTEIAPKLTPYITKRTFFISALLTGVYAGVFGAGFGLLLVALLRIRHPKDEQISFAKIQSRFIEGAIFVVAVATHWIGGNLIAIIWVPWAIGQLIGGYIGALVLEYMSTLSGKIQKMTLYIAYVISIVTAAIHF